MQKGKIMFPQWMPDLPAYENMGLITAKNAIPGVKGYLPVPSLITFSTGALTGFCRGAHVFEDNSENYFNIFGSGTKLEQLSGLTFSDVTRSASSTTSASYSAGTDNDSRWEFVQFGNKAIATNFNDVPQIATIGTPFPKFANMGGGPPRAKHVAIVREFVVFGNVQDNGGGNHVPYKVIWSGINNAESYTAAAATQAGFQSLVQGGDEVQGIVGGEYGTIFQENSITRMTYVGAPIIFRFDVMEQSRGCIAPGSVIAVGPDIYFLARDGFFKITTAGTIPIGANKVNNWFLADFDSNYSYRLSSAVNVDSHLVMWAYPGSGHTGGNPNRIIIYNWQLDAWGYIEQPIEFLYDYASSSISLDDLSAYYASIDSMIVPLDSNTWRGGARTFAGVNSLHKVALFTGAAMSAVFETPETQLTPFKRSFVNSIRPLVDGGSSTVEIGSRDTLSASVAWSASHTQNANGEIPLRSNSRYHRMKLTTSGDYVHAMGLEVTYKPEGMR